MADEAKPEHVILLHGMVRTKRSMAKMEKALASEGYRVWNISYPSRSATVEVLAEAALPGAIANARREGAETVHFVTHSLGGILLRHYLKQQPRLPELGRVVMLSPPNGGSEVVDKLGRGCLYRWINGPAGVQLGTGADDLPKSLGPVDYALGIITGDRSINWILSLMIPGKDDGKVSVCNAQVEGMHDFIVLHATHPFIMKNRRSIQQTIHFLGHGLFRREKTERRG